MIFADIKANSDIKAHKVRGGVTESKWDKLGLSWAKLSLV